MLVDQYEEKKRKIKNEKYLKMGCLEKTNLFEQLLKVEDKQQIAIKEDEETITYSDLIDNSLKYAKLFLSAGIRKGDTVLLQIPNSRMFTEVCFGLWRIGAIPIFAIPALRFVELKGIVEVAKPVAYCSDEEYLGFEYRNLAESLSRDNQILKHLFFTNELRRMILEIEMLKEEECDYPDYYDIAVMMLSSGTTGTPKLIPRGHADLCLNAHLAAERVKLTNESCYLEIVPVQHILGFAQPGMLGTLFSGGKIIICRVPNPEDILGLIEREKVTITSMVPSLALTLIDFLNWGEYDVSSIKDIIVGGAYVDKRIINKFEKFFPGALRIAYGFSEGMISITPKECICIKDGNYGGFPLSEQDELIIVNEEGIEIANGEEGELLAKGPYTISAYYMNKKANEKFFTEDGFYRTGDRAKYTKDGNIQILGRTRELINRCGEKIVPIEVEEHLRMNSKIRDAIVVGLRDELMGQKICAFLVMTDGETIDLREINIFFDELGVCSFKRPDKIRIIEKFPLTRVGKIDRIALERMAEE